MRIKGDEYEAAAADLDILVSLRRVVPVLGASAADERAYETRELRASAPISAGTRARRRAVLPREPSPEPQAPPSADES